MLISKLNLPEQLGLLALNTRRGPIAPSPFQGEHRHDRDRP
jgi:hypothetical protein